MNSETESNDGVGSVISYARSDYTNHDTGRGPKSKRRKMTDNVSVDDLNIFFNRHNKTNSNDITDDTNERDQPDNEDIVSTQYGNVDIHIPAVIVNMETGGESARTLTFLILGRMIRLLHREYTSTVTIHPLLHLHLMCFIIKQKFAPLLERRSFADPDNIHKLVMKLTERKGALAMKLYNECLPFVNFQYDIDTSGLNVHDAHIQNIIVKNTSDDDNTDADDNNDGDDSNGYNSEGDDDDGVDKIRTSGDDI